MSLCAKFPCNPANTGNGDVKVEEHLEPIVSETGSDSGSNDVDDIKIELNESWDLVEESRCVQHTSPHLTKSNNLSDNVVMSESQEMVQIGTSEVNQVQVEIEMTTPKGKKKSLSQKEKRKVDSAEWERLRRMYSTDGPRNKNHLDSVDWEAVRCAKLKEVAETIRERGQHYILASQIQVPGLK